MRWILLGIVLGLLLLYPSLLTAVAAAVAALLSKPVVVAFGVGVVARPAIAHRMQRWAR
ncbi:hypothetical protein HLK59_10150 [Streptomyces sp. S3(2020)]|uniref:hypothetical protein n=1 Tax=Streptomyces sp. S3(2020) TaxID=2732044 RepID=UPI0014876936|nr:hypothetical protein [Streptomyces sp. S3(2020)]NNN30718.1 hypothetical protein [Streptomyces sp. S3(2020)]